MPSCHRKSYHRQEGVTLMDSALSLSTIFFVVGALALVVVTNLRWNKIRRELFPNGMPNGEETGGRANLVTVRAGLGAQLLARSLDLIRSASDPAARAGVEALKAASGAEGEKAIERVLAEAVESAEIHSVLLGKNDTYVYVVALPTRAEHAHLLRRNSPFAAGWLCHAELLRDAIRNGKGGANFAGMTSMLLFVSADGNEAKLQLSCCDATSMLIPATLAEGTPDRSPEVRTSNLEVDFRLAA